MLFELSIYIYLLNVKCRACSKEVPTLRNHVDMRSWIRKENNFFVKKKTLYIRSMFVDHFKLLLKVSGFMFNGCSGSFFLHFFTLFTKLHNCLFKTDKSINFSLYSVVFTKSFLYPFLVGLLNEIWDALITMNFPWK